MPSQKSSVGQSAPDLEIVGDKITLHPSGFTGGPEPQDDQIMERNLVQHMSRFRESPFEFFREVSLHMSGTGWRAYNEPLGQPVFYSGFTERMKTDVLASPLLKNKVKEMAGQALKAEEAQGLLELQKGTAEEKRTNRRKEIQRNLQEVVESMLNNMICKMESKWFIRGAYYICTQLLTRAYHQGIHVSSEEILRLRSVAEKAAQKKQSIIFLPCHKSHVDYVSLQLICYRLGISLPVVVAGENLNMFLLGDFLQHAGAMWIRRSFGNDALYSTVVQAYIDTLLQRGFNFECFIEGGRSRTGKLMPPKFGILKYIIDSVLSGRVEDTIICPVSTQYDKVLETESYISELLGQPKRKEDLSGFLSSFNVLSLKLGRVDVRFHQPWSLREYIGQQLTRMSVQVNPNGPQDLSDDQRTRLFKALGYKVLGEINGVSVMMPTALVGTVLLTLRGRGVGKSELVRRVDWLCERVRAKGGRVAHFYRRPTEVVVDRALDVLGPKLVGKVESLAEPTYKATDRFQMSFYRNMTIHLFVSEALVSAAMYTKIKQGGAPTNQRIAYTDLAEQVTFLSKLFRNEFVYPIDGLRTNLENTVEGLEKDDVVMVTRNSSGLPEIVELSQKERACGRENYDFYCFLIWPFIEAAWLGSVSLIGLTPLLDNNLELPIPLKHAQDSAQLLGKTLYHQGDLSYFEAVNKESLKNAYEQFAEHGIITIRKDRDSLVEPSLKFSPEWIPSRDASTGKILPQGRLWEFTDKIAQSRREGKNRRDGATVTTRVLAMSDKVGRQLLEKLDAAARQPSTVVPSPKL